MKKSSYLSLVAAGVVLAAASYWLLCLRDRPTIVREQRAHRELAESFKEAPLLTQRVAAGELPPVRERLPKIPLLVQPEAATGAYGGTWHLVMRSKDDHGSFIRTIGYENLVRWNTTWTGIVPNVAQSYEASADGREYVFHLRAGMNWSDGQPFTADDVMFWYEDVFSNPELTATAPVWLTANGTPVVVEKIDALTVKFKFAKPNGLFLTALAHPQGAEPTAYPRHYLQQFLPKYNPEVAKLAAAAGVADWQALWAAKLGKAGSVDSMSRWQNPELPTLNAWTLTGRYGTDAVLVASRNPYYWKTDTEGNQLPYLDAVEFFVTDDAEVMVQRALTGKIDLQDRHIGNSSLSILANRARLEAGRATGGYRFFETVPANMNALAISLNFNHKDPVLRALFQNRRFRVAFSQAIDRPAVIKDALGGIGEPYQLAPRPESQFYDREMAKQYTDHDAAAADRALDALGLQQRDADGWRLRPDGRRLSLRLDATGDPKPIELIAAQLKEVGVEVVPNVVSDRQALYARKAANDHDAVVWTGDGGLDVIQEPRFYFPYSNESNYALEWAKAYYQPGAPPPADLPEATRLQQDLYRQLVGIPDQGRQAELMKQILRIAKEQFYAIGVSLTGATYGIVSDRLGNVPQVMPAGWVYPNPAPTNPCQYYFRP